MRTCHFTPLLLLFGFSLVSPRPAHAVDRPCSASPSARAAVVRTMRTMYAAAAKDDFALFNQSITPDFYAFDGGHPFRGDALLDSVRNFQKQGYVFVWTVTSTQVHIACSSNPEIAWITYLNRGSITTPAGVTTPMQWLESAVLEKQGTHWRIRFFHSTRVPPPKK